MLSNALYLCSEQADGKGQDKLTFLKRQGVPSISSLSDIDIRSNQLPDCSHHSWTYVVNGNEKSQAARKRILTNTVNSVFGSNAFVNTIGSLFGSAKKTKYRSFAELLYYSHILFDYLADDPEATMAFVGGNMVPSYSGMRYEEVNGGIPDFNAQEKQSTALEIHISDLDIFTGRCGPAFAVLSHESMDVQGPPRPKLPDPAGWNNKQYPSLIPRNDLYNRCHLLARQFCLVDNEYNLITGTSYLNDTMKEFEDRIVRYLKNSECHVLYRITPIYKEWNTIASGVQLEAYSVEDNGEKICFNVYCYNVQPGVSINYVSGESELADMTYNTTNILPFAVYGASESNPDLIFEIDKQLATLFADQAESGVYNEMQQQIKAVSIKARENSFRSGDTAQKYQEMNAIKFEYFKVLRAYLPLLFSHEDFFSSVFK